MTSIVIANGPGVLDNGQEVILFPSRWDSGIPGGRKKPFAFYPYELALLSSLLKRELPDDNVKFLDGNLESWGGDRYIQEIAKLQPDVLICECSALTYPTMTRVMEKVRAQRSILCGPMGGYDAQRAYVDGWTDVVVGEYELKVLGLLGGTVPPEAYTHGLVNLDWLPWPEDEDVRREKYREINHYIDYRSNDAIIQLYPTRGCPLQCTFCTVPSLYGGHGHSQKSHRVRDMGDVSDEIEYMVALGKSQGWQFAGAYFNEESHNANTTWLVSFCEELIRRGLNKYMYDAMTLMMPWTPELVRLAKRAGYRQIRFGLESTSAQVGKAIKKTVAKDKTERFLGWLKEAGIGAYATAQVGAMGSTEESDRATIADIKDWIRRGMIQKWQLSTSTPQVNTPFWDLCKKNGYLITENFDDFDGYRATCNFPNYSAAQIQHVRDTAGL
jgi:radical SAM superfamily enzyme YgiQ (UPF0313 family)